MTASVGVRKICAFASVLDLDAWHQPWLQEKGCPRSAEHPVLRGTAHTAVGSGVGIHVAVWRRAAVGPGLHLVLRRFKGQGHVPILRRAVPIVAWLHVLRTL